MRQQAENRGEVAKPDAFLNKAAALADLVFSAGSLLAVFVFAYFFYFYTVTGQREFSGGVSLVFYYGFPLAVAIALFALRRLPPARKIDALLLLITCGVSVYGLELFMEWRMTYLYSPTRPVMSQLSDSRDRRRDAAELEKQWGVTIDTRTADEVLPASGPARSIRWRSSLRATICSSPGRTVVSNRRSRSTVGK